MLVCKTTLTSKICASYKPDVIKGDMDSIRTEVLDFYANLVTFFLSFVHKPLNWSCHSCMILKLVTLVKPLQICCHSWNWHLKIHDMCILYDKSFCAFYVIMVLLLFGFCICSVLEPFSGCLCLFIVFREPRYWMNLKIRTPLIYINV